VKLDKSPQFEFTVNQASYTVLWECPLIRKNAQELLKEVVGAARTQSVRSLDMSFEEYKDLRTKSVGGK
jgi:hypothetical protein